MTNGHHHADMPPLTIAIVGSQPNRDRVGHRMRSDLPFIDLVQPDQLDLVEVSARSHLAIAVLPVRLSDPSAAAIDIWIDSAADVERAIERIRGYASNLQANRMHPAGPPRIHPWTPDWAITAGRSGARLAHILTGLPLRIEHIGSTSVPGLAAKNIVDLQIGVPDFEGVDGRDDALAAAGFVNVQRCVPNSPAVMFDNPRGSDLDRAHWSKRLYVSNDPGQRVIVHVRRQGSPGWRYALIFRDWLRANPQARVNYEQLKRELADAHAEDVDNDDYTRAKEAWFAQAHHDAEAWAAATGWVPQTGWVGVTSSVS